MISLVALPAAVAASPPSSEARHFSDRSFSSSSSSRRRRPVVVVALVVELREEGRGGSHWPRMSSCRLAHPKPLVKVEYA